MKAKQHEFTVISFLSSEPFITAEIATLLFGFSSPKSVYKVLNQLIKKEILLKRDICTGLGKSPVRIFSLTHYGKAMAEEVMGMTIKQQSSKISETMIPHTIDVQKVKVILTKRKYSNRIGENQIPPSIQSSLNHRPDAIVTHPNGRVVAFEMERTLKSTKRYQSILAGFYNAIQKDDIQGVLYVCNHEQLERVLKRTFSKLIGKNYLRNGVPITISAELINSYIKVTNINALKE
jgi:DNA-binding PadR family transcriptional regulator